MPALSFALFQPSTAVPTLGVAPCLLSSPKPQPHLASSLKPRPSNRLLPRAPSTATAATESEGEPLFSALLTAWSSFDCLQCASLLPQCLHPLCLCIHTPYAFIPFIPPHTCTSRDDNHNLDDESDPGSAQSGGRLAHPACAPCTC